MTTILGIKTNSGEEGIVLAADTQLTTFEGEQQTEKSTISKLKTGADYALAFVTGQYDDEILDRFFKYLRGTVDFEQLHLKMRLKKEAGESSSIFYLLQQAWSKKINEKINELSTGKTELNSEFEKIIANFKDFQPKNELDEFFHALFSKIIDRKTPIREAIQTGYLGELDLINRYLTKRANEKEDATEATELILASSNPLKLYYIDGYGNLIESMTSKPEYVCLGSGKSIVQNYFDENGYKEDKFLKEISEEDVDVTELTLPAAIRLALGSLKKASRDANTSGIELVVVRETKIVPYGELIKRKIEDAEIQAYKEIIAKNNPETKEPPKSSPA
jgi:20S proteasome alpha/beta subunit